MASKLKQKGRAILRHKSSYHFPDFKIMDYKISMLNSLNYYSSDVDDKEKQQFAINYWNSQGKDTKEIAQLKPFWFSTIGAVAHMVHVRKLPIEDFDITRLEAAYIQLQRECKNQDSIEVEPVVVKESAESIQSKMDSLASKYIGDVEHAFDQFIFNGESFDTKRFIQTNNIKGPVAKKIGQWFKAKIPELSDAYTGADPDLLEGYGNIGRRGLKKAVMFVQEIVSTCENMVIIARTTKAPRAKKQQIPSKVVAKMKYLKEYSDLGLKSVHPEKIIGASEIWLYDTAKRRLIKYVVQDGAELSVKGTTIMNFDPAKSGSKIVRKPEVTLKGLDDYSKRPMSNLFNSIKGTTGIVRGRTADSQLILKVFG